jgi:hypothetical protein
MQLKRFKLRFIPYLMLPKIDLLGSVLTNILALKSHFGRGVALSGPGCARGGVLNYANPSQTQSFNYTNISSAELLHAPIQLPPEFDIPSVKFYSNRIFKAHTYQAIIPYPSWCRGQKKIRHSSAIRTPFL